MKKLALITLFVFSLILANAQNHIPFPTENTTWRTEREYWSGGFEPQITYYEFAKTNGDTIIDGKQYTIITRPNYPTCFIREDNGLVYCKYSSNPSYYTSEFLLYNFNLQVGDTMQTVLIYDGLYEYWTLRVVSEGSLLVGDTYHKKIVLSGWNEITFIEGVGSMQGLFYQEIPPTEWFSFLTCFSMNDTIFSLNGDGSTRAGTCWEITDIKEPESSTITVSPNPTSNFIRINAPQISKAELFTINGQKVLETKSQNINLMDYESGIYVLKVHSADKSVKIFKVVKQ